MHIIYRFRGREIPLSLLLLVALLLSGTLVIYIYDLVADSNGMDMVEGSLGFSKGDSATTTGSGLLDRSRVEFVSW